MSAICISGPVGVRVLACVVALGLVSLSSVASAADAPVEPSAVSASCSAGVFGARGSVTAFGLAPTSLLVQAMFAQCWGPDFCYCSGGGRQSGNTFYITCGGVGCCPNENPFCSGTREANVTCGDASAWGSDYDYTSGCYVWCHDESTGSTNYGWCC